MLFFKEVRWGQNEDPVMACSPGTEKFELEFGESLAAHSGPRGAVILVSGSLKPVSGGVSSGDQNKYRTDRAEPAEMFLVALRPAGRVRAWPSLVVMRMPVLPPSLHRLSLVCPSGEESGHLHVT